MPGDFKSMLEARFALGKYLCVGLDPSPEELRKLHNPNDASCITDYLIGIIEATAPYAAAFKPNRAFYEWMGKMGDEVLRRIVGYIRTHHPDIPVILDNKLGDIAATNNGYVAMLDAFGVNAQTLNPYLGSKAMEPFLVGNRYSFILCKTSNDGSEQFQDAEVRAYVNDSTGFMYTTKEEYMAATNGDKDNLRRRKMPMYLYVAQRVGQDWDTLGGGAGLVVGATYPKHLMRVLKRAAGAVILVPGLGTQNGNPSEAFAAADDNLLLVNVSSGITKNPNPAEAAMKFNDQVAGWMAA
jgi:orotidine 5'-phosphate decarboxylase subfamily 2